MDLFYDAFMNLSKFWVDRLSMDRNLSVCITTISICVSMMNKGPKCLEQQNGRQFMAKQTL